MLDVLDELALVLLEQRDHLRDAGVDVVLGAAGELVEIMEDLLSHPLPDGERDLALERRVPEILPGVDLAGDPLGVDREAVGRVDLAGEEFIPEGRMDIREVRDSIVFPLHEQVHRAELRRHLLVPVDQIPLGPLALGDHDRIVI